MPKHKDTGIDLEGTVQYPADNTVWSIGLRRKYILKAALPILWDLYNGAEYIDSDATDDFLIYIEQLIK